jgi:hypothetical protein
VPTYESYIYVPLLPVPFDLSFLFVPQHILSQGLRSIFDRCFNLRVTSSSSKRHPPAQSRWTTRPTNLLATNILLPSPTFINILPARTTPGISCSSNPKVAHTKSDPRTFPWPGVLSQTVLLTPVSLKFHSPNPPSCIVPLARQITSTARQQHHLEAPHLLILLQVRV